MLDPFIVDTIEAWVSDFTETPAFSRLAHKEQAPALLAEFLKRSCEFRGGMPGDLTEADLRPVLLDYLPSLNLPLDVRQAAPDMIAPFLAWLQDAGRLADGAHLASMIEVMASTYRARCGEGGLKPAPVKRQAAAIGRNDPCPCGSGRKYKKCCGGNA